MLPPLSADVSGTGAPRPHSALAHTSDLRGVIQRWGQTAGPQATLPTPTRAWVCAEQSGGFLCPREEWQSRASRSPATSSPGDTAPFLPEAGAKWECTGTQHSPGTAPLTSAE